MITLYDYELSVECYQARLMLALLGLEHDRVDVEMYPGREHESAWFTELSPLRQMPVLVDGDLVLNDVHAVLVYLAVGHDPARSWLPCSPAATVAEVTAWLGLARRLSATAGAARRHLGFCDPVDIDQAQQGAHELLRVLDEHLWYAERAGREWVCSPAAPTIADIALFPDVAVSEEGGVSRIDYPAVRRWTDRVRRIPGFIPMSGIFPVSHFSAESLTARHQGA